MPNPVALCHTPGTSVSKGKYDYFSLQLLIHLSFATSTSYMQILWHMSQSLDILTCYYLKMQYRLYLMTSWKEVSQYQHLNPQALDSILKVQVIIIFNPGCPLTLCDLE